MIGLARSTEFLTGWAGTAPTPAEVVHPTSTGELADTLSAPAPRGIIARGLGRSYGDPAQNAGGLVACTSGVSGIHHLDLERGVVTAEAGTTIDALIRWLVPLGWFVPVTPGTRQVTVGGAIASDVHGKNHHLVGSWCQGLEAITLATPAGGLQRVTPGSDPELFWATAGGMGLTGIIIDATIRLTPIRTSLLSVDTDRTSDLDATLALMEANDHAYDYSVAWIDLMAKGVVTGRSVLDRGHFAEPEQLKPGQRQDPLAFRSTSLGTVPALPARGLINRSSVRIFNEVWYRKAPRRRRGHLQTIGQFFHPLDAVGRWNRVYGPSGLLQWQCAVPFGAEEDLRWIVDRISGSGRPSFLAVLKRFGPGNLGPLSFPMEGWTLALDVPAGNDPELGTLLDTLDERVVEAGGRIYLAKDSRMRPDLLAAMYPRLDEWRAVRNRADPDAHMVSDLSRRLSLI